MDISLFFQKKPHEVKQKSARRFDKWSRKYDRSILQAVVFRCSRRMFMRNILRDDRIKSVLDVGCGTGEFALQLKKKKKEIDVSGLDLSNDMIMLARSKAKAEGDISVKFKVGDVANMPYPDSQFDCITCAHSFHHYPLKKKAIKEMFRVLKNNGKLMIIDGCKDGLFGKFIFDFIIKRHEGDVHHLHSNQYLRLLRSAGFEGISQTIFNFPVSLLFTKGIVRKAAS